MIGQPLSLAEKSVKIAIGVGKLAVTGGLTLDSAKHAVDALKNGHDIYASLAATAPDLTRTITATLTARMDALAASPEMNAAAHDRRAHFEQALDHCIPAPEALRDAALDAALDPTDTSRAVIALMRQRLLAQGPPILTRYYRDPTSLDSRFFAAVLTAALVPFFADEAQHEALGRAIDSRLLGDVADLKRNQSQQDAKLDRILAALDARGDTAAAEAAGVQRDAVLALARRISASVADFHQALAELEQAVEIAIEVRAAGAQGSNLGVFIDDVLRRLADLTATGRFEEAGEAADAAIAAWERDEADRRTRADAELARLLEAGERQDLLRGDAEAAAAKIVRRVELETAEPARFHALRATQGVWYERGRNRGLDLDLKVAIALARAALDVANGTDERGTALNDVGVALQHFGQRVGDAATLRDAVSAHREALEVKPRDRDAFEWAGTQNNLGNALSALGGIDKDAATLRGAIGAYHAALEEWGREREPPKWAGVQINLGTTLLHLGNFYKDADTLRAAAKAFRAALGVRSIKWSPDAWKWSPDAWKWSPDAWGLANGHLEQ